ncbi:MAG: glycosyltransferase [Candidatus Woesearchaeota archaeon]|jgi:glycosyltransferase involved in cell wall biosynthesis
MIARNEEQTIQRAIDSVKKFVNEIIVVDTGSEDNTRRIAQDCGATVYDFKWENDFAKARNFALSMAKSEWVLVIDADECMSPNDVKDILHVVDREEKKSKQGEQIVAYAFVSRHYTPKGEPAKYAHWHELNKEEKEVLVNEFPLFEGLEGYYDVQYITRLFKNNKHIYYTGTVHEDVNPSIITWDKQEPQKIIVQSSIPIHHFHFLKSRNYVTNKQKMYFELSKEKIKHGKDAKTSLDLAVGYVLFEKNLDKSFDCLKDAIIKEHTDKKVVEYVTALQAKNKKLRALNELLKLDLSDHDFNSLLNLAKAYYHRKIYHAAIIVFKRLFEIVPHDPLIVEYLGVCYDHIMHSDDAIRVFEHGIIVHPENPIFYFNLGALYEKVKAWDKAIAAFNKAVQYNHPLMEQIPARIEMLKKYAKGNHIDYKINIGNV